MKLIMVRFSKNTIIIKVKRIEKKFLQLNFIIFRNNFLIKNKNIYILIYYLDNKSAFSLF